MLSGGSWPRPQPYFVVIVVVDDDDVFVVVVYLGDGFGS